ncbi:MAG: outer membrane protein transport protein [Ignavibacteria bacterium]|nr:outer membrane protein transport protein [Ignavibacteria bacterium]
MREKCYITIIILALTAGKILAGGFQINEHGAKAMAMGGAYTAIANDPSAIYWNAAGMTQMQGTNFLIGTALISPKSTFRGVTPSVDINYMKSNVFFPSHLFVTHSFTSSLSAGIGITTPFGLGTEWEDDWIGRYLAIKTQLTTFWVPVTLAYNVLDNLSISGGFIYSFADVLITRKNSQSPFEGDAFVELEGNDHSAFGYSFGLMFKPFKDVSIGATFRSEIDYEFKGEAKTTGAQQLLEIGSLPNGDVTAKLTSPMNIVGGIAVQVFPQLLLSADFQWIGWSSYDTLGVNFEDPDFEDLASPRLYEDTFIIRFGGQYNISDDVAVLGGVYYDKKPVKNERISPSLPETDRLGFSFGADAKITKNFGIAGSYLYIRGNEITVTDSKEIYTPGNSPFNGTYNTTGHLLSFSFYYNIP